MMEIHNNPNAVLLAEAYEMGQLCEVTFYDLRSSDPEQTSKAVGYITELLNDGIIILVFTDLYGKHKDKEVADLTLSKASIMIQDIAMVETPVSFDEEFQIRVNEYLYNKKAITGFNTYNHKVGKFQDVKDLYKHESTFIKQAEATFKEMKNHAMNGINGYTTEVELTYPEDREFEVKPTMLQALKDKIKILFGMRL